MLDRIDLQINVQSIEYDTIKANPATCQSSKDLYAGVQNALDAQQQRFGNNNQWNAYMSAEQVDKLCLLTA